MVVRLRRVVGSVGLLTALMPALNTQLCVNGLGTVEALSGGKSSLASFRGVQKWLLNIRGRGPLLNPLVTRLSSMAPAPEQRQFLFGVKQGGPSKVRLSRLRGAYLVLGALLRDLPSLSALSQPNKLSCTPSSSWTGTPLLLGILLTHRDMGLLRPNPFLRITRRTVALANAPAPDLICMRLVNATGWLLLSLAALQSLLKLFRGSCIRIVILGVRTLLVTRLIRAVKVGLLTASGADRVGDGLLVASLDE